MSVHEYVSVFISIIIGLALADLLVSFHRLIRVDSRVRWYWLVLAVAVYLLLVIVNFWWGTFHWYEHMQTISMGQFVPTLLSAIVLFLVAASVLPDEVPAAGLDLKAWYVLNSPHIWTLASIGLFLVIALEASGQLTSFKAAAIFAKSEWENLLLLAGSIALIFVKRLRMHEFYVVLALADMVYTAASLQIG